MTKRIAVYAIVKNEIKHVDRWYEACKGADSIVVLDTGSTDGTYERLLEYPLEAHKATVEPFRFDVARNMALDLISPDIDVCVSIDLDEIPDLDLFDKLRQQWKPDTGRAWVNWDTGNIWANNNRVHARHGYSWKYPCHEIIVPDAGVDTLITIDSCVRHRPDDDKSRGQYLDLLQVGYNEDPSNSRMLVYLVREYYFKNMHDKVIEYGTKILNVKDIWNVELAQVCRQVGDSYVLLGNNKDALIWYLRGTQVLPDELEPWVSLAQYYHNNQMWELCAWASDKVNNLKPLTHYISDVNSIWRLTDLLSLSFWNLGYRGTALVYAKKAMNLNPNNERLINNYKIINDLITKGN